LVRASSADTGATMTAERIATLNQSNFIATS
jgi:hypothetical protein